ncbi:hypothetical protein OP492_00240 [Pseudomonas mosselii]|uniref:hypothetical protein n=1 Tax=Pseudomonas mosselii TaxID=78327 RepID=UPI0021A6E90C|nr:hypothetical protein [Pseudomonas mosselii]MEA3233085.1 hypothetical protein [Pseudomonas mosselii]UWS65594.1 hypothetical protein N0U38_17610 [Pseudomonas mosselii]
MSLSISNIHHSSRVDAQQPVTEGQKACQPLWAMLAMPCPAASAAFAEWQGRVSLDPPQQLSCSTDRQAVLAILWAAMQVRDGMALERRAHAEVSILASKEQIDWMINATQKLFASAFVSALLGVITLGVGCASMFKNIGDAGKVKALKTEVHDAKFGKATEPAGLETATLKELASKNGIQIEDLQSVINTRNATLQMLNGVAQNGAAFGTGIAHAIKSLEDVWAKEEELAAAIAGNQKELAQRQVDELIKMVDKMISLMQEMIRNDNQGFRAAGIMA